MKSKLLAFFFLLSPFALNQAESYASEAPLRADESITVPPLTSFSTLKNIYKSDGSPQVLMVIHFPKEGSKESTFIELHNLTKRNISIFQFSIHSVGQIGDLSFEDLPAGWSGVKETTMTNLRELTIIQPRAIDDQAMEFYPKLVIHYEIGLNRSFGKTARKKIAEETRLQPR